MPEFKITNIICVSCITVLVTISKAEQYIMPDQCITKVAPLLLERGLTVGDRDIKAALTKLYAAITKLKTVEEQISEVMRRERDFATDFSSKTELNVLKNITSSAVVLARQKCVAIPHLRSSVTFNDSLDGTYDADDRYNVAFSWALSNTMQVPNTVVRPFTLLNGSISVVFELMLSSSSSSGRRWDLPRAVGRLAEAVSCGRFRVVIDGRHYEALRTQSVEWTRVSDPSGSGDDDNNSSNLFGDVSWFAIAVGCGAAGGLALAIVYLLFHVCCGRKT